MRQVIEPIYCYTFAYNENEIRSKFFVSVSLTLKIASSSQLLLKRKTKKKLTGTCVLEFMHFLLEIIAADDFLFAVKSLHFACSTEISQQKYFLIFTKCENERPQI